LDLGGRVGDVCEVEWIREVKSLKSSSSSQRGNLKWFHGEKDDEKNVIEKKEF
jgi:hypothetical protein